MKSFKNKLLIELVLKWQKLEKQKADRAVAGFTLLELLITLLIVGILFAISATTWTGFLNGQRINQANQKIFAVLQEAQTKSRQQNQAHSVSFRNDTSGGGGLQYVVTLKGATPGNGEWKSLFENKRDSIELSFYSPNSNNIAELKTQTFNYQGVPEDTNLDVNKRIIVSPKDGSGSRKCVIVQDLLGNLRNEADDDCTKNDSGVDISGNIQVLN